MLGLEHCLDCCAVELEFGVDDYDRLREAVGEGLAALVPQRAEEAHAAEPSIGWSPKRTRTLSQAGIFEHRSFLGVEHGMHDPDAEVVPAEALPVVALVPDLDKSMRSAWK